VLEVDVGAFQIFIQFQLEVCVIDELHQSAGVFMGDCYLRLFDLRIDAPGTSGLQSGAVVSPQPGNSHCFLVLLALVPGNSEDVGAVKEIVTVVAGQTSSACCRLSAQGHRFPLFLGQQVVVCQEDFSGHYEDKAVAAADGPVVSGLAVEKFHIAEDLVCTA
jgi:hypothetical protein